MKAKVVFWGTFLIFLGLFILMYNFDIFEFKLSEILTWWPILFIFWGALLLKLPEIVKQLIAAVSGVLLSLIIVVFFASGIGFVNDFSPSIKVTTGDSTDEVCEEKADRLEEKVKYGRLNFSGGAGKFTIASNSDYFYKINSGTKDCVINIDRPDDSTAVLNYTFGEGTASANSNRTTRVEVDENLIWDMDLSTGAAKMIVDLAKIRLSELNIDAGASDTEIYLGETNSLTKVNINCGAAKFKISVPKNMGCSVQGDMALSKKIFEGLKENSAGVFISDNYYSSKGKIDFYIDGAISTIVINRD
ncbi:DUF5668 domain-containing protein [Candidatus Kapaibacterium sp.]